MQLFNKLNYIMSIKFMFVAVFCVIKNKKIVFFFDRLFYVAEFLSVRNNSTVLLPFCEVRENNWNKMFCCFTVSIRKCGKKELSIDLSVCISYLIVDISLVPIMSSNLRKILMRCWLNSSKIFSWKNSNSNFELNMFFTWASSWSQKWWKLYFIDFLFLLNFLNRNYDFYVNFIYKISIVYYPISTSFLILIFSSFGF